MAAHRRRHSRPPPPDLAFTRYCFTSTLYCVSQSSISCPPHLQSLPYCNTIARPLRNTRPPPPTHYFYSVHHTVLVMAISCKGQHQTREQSSTAAAHTLRVHPTLALWCCSCRVVCCGVVVLFLSCRVLCCSCCVFVCVTCFSSPNTSILARLTRTERE